MYENILNTETLKKSIDFSVILVMCKPPNVTSHLITLVIFLCHLITPRELDAIPTIPETLCPGVATRGSFCFLHANHLSSLGLNLLISYMEQKDSDFLSFLLPFNDFVLISLSVSLALEITLNNILFFNVLYSNLC